MNTRLFDHPQTIDNKNDIDKLVQNVLKQNLVEKLTRNRDGSAWKFYEFLYVCLDVYEMESPIGAGIELPQHLLTGSNQRYLIKYNEYDDNLCFWRCLAYYINKPSDPRRVEQHVKNYLMNIMKTKKILKNIVEYNILNILKIMMMIMRNL